MRDRLTNARVDAGTKADDPYAIAHTFKSIGSFPLPRITIGLAWEQQHFSPWPRGTPPTSTSRVGEESS